MDVQLTTLERIKNVLKLLEWVILYFFLSREQRRLFK